MFWYKYLLAALVIIASLCCSSTTLAARQQGTPVALTATPTLTATAVPRCQALDVLSNSKWHRSIGASEQYMGLIYVVSSSKNCVFSIPFDPAILSLSNAAGTLQPVLNLQTTQYVYTVGAYNFYDYVLLAPHTVHSNQASNRCPFPAFC